MNKIIRYFDLASEIRPKIAKARSENQPVPPANWQLQYLALLLGIIVQRFFHQYMTTGTWNLSGLGGWVIASIILAIVIFPGIYKNSFDPERPIFVQLCVIFTSGMGWQSLASTILKGS